MSIKYNSQQNKPGLKSNSGNIQPRYGTYGNAGNSAPLITTPKATYGTTPPVVGGSGNQTSNGFNAINTENAGGANYGGASIASPGSSNRVEEAPKISYGSMNNQNAITPTPTTPTYGSMGAYKVDTTPVQVAPSGGYGFSNRHITQEGQQTPSYNFVGGTPSSGNGSSQGTQPPADTPATEDVQTPTTPMTYREFIEQEKNKALQAAEVERQRAVIDANASYEQNKATYGANAEALRRQGLTGSGYSDYIDAQAYATSRGEVQQANVLAAQAKDKANTTYAENMLALKEKEEAELKTEEAAKQEKYVGLLADAGTGKYTVDQLRQFGAEFGLSEEQITQIVNAANKYSSNAQNKAYQDMLTSENTSISSINAAVSAGTITQEQAQQLIGNIQNNNYLVFSYDISNGEIDQDAVRIALEAGELTQEQVDKLKAEYMAGINKIDASSYFKNKAQDVAKSELEIIETDPWITDEVKDKFVWEYNAIFNPNANASNDNDNSSSTSGISYQKSGENGYVNIYDSNYSSSHFGDYYDTGKEGTKQEKYISKIVEDAKLGKITIGKLVVVNYGSSPGETDSMLYRYMGNGIFVNAQIHVDNGNYNRDDVYVPDGYKFKDSKWHKFWYASKIVED